MFNSYKHPIVINLHRIRFNTAFIAVKTLSRYERKSFFVKGACYRGFIIVTTYHTPAQSHLVAMRTLVLCSIPFTATREIEKRDLFIVVLHANTAILRYISNL